MLGSAQLDLLVARIVSGYAPDVIGLFGSHAHGTATANSDIDLFILKRTTEPSRRRAAQVRRLVPMLCKVDVVVLTHEELAEARRQPHSFHDTVSRHMKILYVRPGFDRAGLGL